ncbi:MAG: DUF885 family protein [Planctomycetales bacterium]|nr:DUF885 family protein [Planctomycetales bacterium]
MSVSQRRVWAKNNKLPLHKYLSQFLVCFACLFNNDLPVATGSEPANRHESPRLQVQMAVEQFAADSKTLRHRYRVPLDKDAYTVRSQNLADWLQTLDEVTFEDLDRASKIDFLLLRSEIDYQQQKLELEHRREQQAAELIPYVDSLISFCRNRENVTSIDARAIAEQLDATASKAEEIAKGVRDIPADVEEVAAARQRITALQAVELLDSFGNCLAESHRFYQGYDPQYTWWVAQPMERLSAAISAHKSALRDHIVGVPESDTETIIGLPIGSEGLKLELAHEWIALSPAELVALAKREMEWCDAEMAKASQALGFGDDWNQAMAHVKSKHVEPGRQPQMIYDLAWEAIRFLEAHDLVTVPPMAANGWRMTMMSPQRQRVNPYFLGGDTIIVSYPTDSMTHEEKLMSMRSNNEHFSRATVHHELIPGHHLQYYMLPRYRSYRTIFSTPFWIEGWALYWEMLLWDLDFAQSAEDRVGMLFWRKHRCARIIFSLSYHLGTMSPEECIDYLIERVGHEPSAAAAEVRRSIMGGYSPLYQAAYMLGGLQLRQLHREFVQSGKLTNRQFHDSVLHEHAMPIEVLRLALGEQELSKNTRPIWRFADVP